MTDDPGVMGNLPRSRPGRRSAKRDGGKPKTAGAKSTRSRAASPKRTTPPKPRASTPRQAERPRPPVKTPPKGPDPVGDAVRIAGKLAGAGLGIAAGVLKRLPRP